MKIKTKTITIQTEKEFQFINITEEIKKFVKESKIKNGIMNIQSLHTTASILINENEPLLLNDIKKHLSRLIPKNCKYQHDDFTIRTVNLCEDECANGHAHCKAILLPTSVVLNIIKGKIQLGQWQQIFFLELDRARQRKIQFHIIGE
ncbi:MAG: hypothetical protein KatS3mg097_607 [Candidatus Parcubacteria bacterium]|nr:MAG: hypothetical protein KatS3mg097_607 [Candidatus Parcubacteria bacterium]